MPTAAVGKQQALEELSRERNTCRRCAADPGVTHYVFGKGTPSARLVLIGEAPGFNEDRAGLPFVGSAGHLLDSLLVSAGFAPDDLYITNVVKCRPGQVIAYGCAIHR